MKFKVIIKIYTFLFLIFAPISSLFADSHVDSCTITNGVFSAAQVIMMQAMSIVQARQTLMKLLLMKCICVQQLQLHPQHLRRWD